MGTWLDLLRADVRRHAGASPSALTALWCGYNAAPRNRARALLGRRGPRPSPAGFDGAPVFGRPPTTGVLEGHAALAAALSEPFAEPTCWEVQVRATRDLGGELRPVTDLGTRPA